MPLPSFPAALGYPKRDGYGYTPGQTHERSDTGGPLETWVRIYSGANVRVPCTLLLASSLMQLLDAFIVVISETDGWFLITVDIGRGLLSYQARIIDIDIPRDLRGVSHWEIPLELEIRAKADGTYWNYTLEEAEAIVLTGGGYGG